MATDSSVTRLYLSLNYSTVGKDGVDSQTEEDDRSQSSDIGGPAGTSTGPSRIESGYTIISIEFDAIDCVLPRACVK